MTEACSPEPAPFQILSLDGGGIKGLFSAAVLAHLEDDLETRIIDHFDLIVGTSTGGLIALALGLEMLPKDIVEFYVERAEIIFPPSIVSRFRHWIYRKHNPAGLEAALVECFNGHIMQHSKKRLVIPAYNLGENDIYLFKTPHDQRIRRDGRVPMWQVGLATSAAPTYFPAFRGIDNMRLIDGGTWANNPAMVGVCEAVSMLGVKLSDISIFSVGTTDEVQWRPSRLDRGGLLQWARPSAEVILQAQSVGVDAQVAHLLGKRQVFRLNPKVPKDLFLLDKLSTGQLLALGAHESRKVSQAFKNTFASHRAERYDPIGS